MPPQEVIDARTRLRLAASVIVVEAAEGKDAADHIAAGYGLDEFVAVPVQPDAVRAEAAEIAQEAQR
jgi:hypothetical protein